MTPRFHDTKTDAIERELAPILNDLEGRFDVNAIADQVIAYTDGHDPLDHQVHLERAGYYLDADEHQLRDVIAHHTL